MSARQTKFTTTITVSDLGQVPHADYPKVTEEIADKIREYAHITDESESGNDRVYTIEIEARDLWDLHEVLVSDVEANISSRGFGCEVARPREVGS